ncbi:hypothetical protein L7F22_011376 [Adiantum nelumboides]|nr:hypothetical protein [Adiantum nelumboides]
MGAAHSKKVGSSLYDDGSWTPSNYSSSQGRDVKMYDPTEKTPRDISGPLGPVDLYGEDTTSEYIGYHDTPTPARVSEKSKNTLKTKVFGVVGRAGTAGLGKAVGALDTIGSSMTNLNKGSGFTSAAAIKANTIGILAFEVANTIAKGYSLKESLSKDSIKFLKEEVLCSYGVQRLVSTDMTELLSIAATDKKWAKAKPVKQITSKDVAKFVYEDICCKSGMPLELFSDKGPGFRGELVDYLCEKLYVRRRHLQVATSNFNQANVVGHGGFGSFYQGVLADGQQAAIKQLDRQSKQGDDEFHIEVDMLSHPLVYEYMPKGNLQEHVYFDGTFENPPILNWETRMRIALDSTKNLEYLRDCVSSPWINRDFKRSKFF